MRAGTAIAVALATALLAPAGASAAAPDGEGPWADSVIHADQGTRKDGTPVLPQRSNPQDAVGPAENWTSAPNTFFSLGFDDPATPADDPGEITLGFDNVICDGPGGDLRLVENTKEPYGRELVDVFGGPSADSLAKLADDVDKDATIDIAGRTTHVKVVRLLDQTPRTGFRSNADAYDVDGVRAVRTESACGTFSGTARGLHVVSPVPPAVLPPTWALANEQDSPCADDEDATVDASVGTPHPIEATSKSVYAETDADPGGEPGCRSEAGAEHLTIGGGDPANSITVQSLTAVAEVRCNGATPVLSGSSKTIGVATPGGAGDYSSPTHIPLGPLGDLYLNEQVVETTPDGTTRLTQRALRLRTALGVDVIVGEATANYEGNPCQT